MLTGPYQPATTPDPWQLPPMSSPPLHSNVAYSPLEAPDKSTNPFWSQRPSSRPDSSASTVKVPSVGDDEPPAQTAVELSRLDLKGAKTENEEVDPFEHLPENEASILRKRKYYFILTTEHLFLLRAKRGISLPSFFVSISFVATPFCRFIGEHFRHHFLT